MSEPNKPFLLVLGMHRSGTSALAGMIDRLGFEAGSNLLEPQADNPQGFWENSRVVDVHDEILSEMSRSWHDPRSVNLKECPEEKCDGFRKLISTILDEEFNTAGLPYLKDPRLYQFLDVWLELLNNRSWDAKCLMIVRSPFEVCESLSKRNGFDFVHSALIWLKSNLEIEKRTRECSRYVLSYDKLLSNPALEIRSFMDHFGYPVATNDEVEYATSHIDSSYRHHVNAELDYTVFGRYSDLVSTAYNALKDLVENKSSSGQCLEVLDKCRDELENYEIISAPWATSRDIAHQESKDDSLEWLERMENAMHAITDAASVDDREIKKKPQHVKQELLVVAENARRELELKNQMIENYQAHMFYEQRFPVKACLKILRNWYLNKKKKDVR